MLAASDCGGMTALTQVKHEKLSRGARGRGRGREVHEGEGERVGT